MLQARLFSYADTHRHRLGVNYQQIPVNCPYAAKVRRIYMINRRRRYLFLYMCQYKYIYIYIICRCFIINIDT